MLKKLLGPIFILLSAMCYGTYGVWSRLMGADFGEFNQAWSRAIIILAVIVPIVIAKKLWKRIARKDLKWFVLIACMGGFNQVPYFLAFQTLEVSTATVLFYSFLTIAGYIVGIGLMKEKLTARIMIALALAILGVVVIFNFSFNFSLWPAVLACVAGLMGGFEVTLTKKVSDNYHNLQILALIFGVMLVGNLALGFVFGESLNVLPRIGMAWLPQLGYAVAMLLGMFLVVAGYKGTSATLGSLIGLTEIVWAAMLAMIVFGEQLTGATIVGGIMILMAAGIPLVKGRAQNIEYRVENET